MDLPLARRRPRGVSLCGITTDQPDADFAGALAMDDYLITICTANWIRLPHELIT